MNIFHKTAVVVAIAFLPGAAANAADPDELSHNPFSRPVSEVTLDDRAAVANSDGLPQVLDLRATMVTTGTSLADVGGKILRPGDDIQGFVLVRVYEDRAVFERLGRQQTVYVKPDQAEDTGRER